MHLVAPHIKALLYLSHQDITDNGWMDGYDHGDHGTCRYGKNGVLALPK